MPLAFKTEHFKLYRVEIDQPPANISISLQGQFDTAAKKHRVVLLTFFGNPVSKNQEPLHNARTHLSCYSLAGAHEPNRTAGVVNQFGKDVLVLGDPQLLLAPAVKQEGDKPKSVAIPKDVSHFKGYRILKHMPFDPRTVALQDQFDREPTKYSVDAPLYFCVPVEKIVGDKKYPMVNPKEHLVLYPIRELTPQPNQQKRPVWDQFKGGLLLNFRAYFLAVPTQKEVWKPGVVDKF